MKKKQGKEREREIVRNFRGSIHHFRDGIANQSVIQLGGARYLVVGTWNQLF